MRRLIARLLFKPDMAFYIRCIMTFGQITLTENSSISRAQTKYAVKNYMYISDKVGILFDVNTSSFFPHIAHVFYRFQIIFTAVFFENFSKFGHIDFDYRYNGFAVKSPSSVK